jgi:arsenate reductase
LTASTVKIEVLVFDGCPNAAPAVELAEAVAGDFETSISVESVAVDSEEKAKSLAFLGSPSIRVNGWDVEGRETSQGTLCCRTYQGGEGVPPRWMVETAVLRALHPSGVLFLCVANSARSQMAEGIARSLAPAGVRVWSAGSKPTKVRHEAVTVLAEIGVDISGHHSKSVTDIAPDGIDAVITLCGEEDCPVFLGQAHRLHWGLDDPAAIVDNETGRLAAFRCVRDELSTRLRLLFGKQAPAEAT